MEETIKPAGAAGETAEKAEISAGPDVSDAAGGQETPAARGEQAAGAGKDKKKPPSSRHKGDAAPEKLREELESLKADNASLKKRLEETDDLFQRLRAEYANYKRRTEQEKEQLSGFVKGETLKALLPAIDSLERAAASPDGDNYKAGVEMTIRQLSDLLAAQGLEAIDPLGKPFEPELHHAVMREDADGVEPDTVTEVYQRGYSLGGRVLRPAMVKVAN